MREISEDSCSAFQTALAEQREMAMLDLQAQCSVIDYQPTNVCNFWN